MDPPSTETVTGWSPPSSPAQIRGPGGGVADTQPARCETTAPTAPPLAHTWKRANASPQIQPVTADRSANGANTPGRQRQSRPERHHQLPCLDHSARHGAAGSDPSAFPAFDRSRWHHAGLPLAWGPWGQPRTHVRGRRGAGPAQPAARPARRMAFAGPSPTPRPRRHRLPAPQPPAHTLRENQSHRPPLTPGGRNGRSGVAEAGPDHDAQRLGGQRNPGRGMGADLSVDVEGQRRVGVQPQLADGKERRLLQRAAGL